MKKTTILIFVVLIILIIISIIYTTLPRLELSGSRNITISYTEKYNEPGVIVKNVTEKNVGKVIIENNIDTTKPGIYYVNYYLKLGKKKLHIRRNIKVIDDVAPIIELKEGQIINIQIHEKYNDSGYKAYDEIDGILTEKVEVIGNVNTEKIGEYVLKYRVEDKSKNITEINRIVKVVEPEVTKEDE